MIREHSIGRLGSRFFLDFIPFRKCVRTSAVGRFFDKEEELVIAVERGGKCVSLPFSEFSASFEDLDERIYPCHLSYSGYDADTGLELSVEILSPHVPGDIQKSSYPFMYMDITVFYKGSTVITGDAITKGCGEELLQDGRMYVGFRGASVTSISGLESSVIVRSYTVDPIVARRKWLDTTFNPEYSRKETDGSVAISSIEKPVSSSDGVMVFQLDGLKKKARRTFRFIISSYSDSDILNINGSGHKFLYTRDLSDLQDVVAYALDNQKELVSLTALFENCIDSSSLGSGYRILVSTGLQSYLVNTWLIDNDGEEWFSVTEGNCSYHNTVDVEYNSGLWYLLYWPDLLYKILLSWNSRIKEGGYMPHDIGKFLVISRMEYSHDMEVEESSDFILLLYALWKWYRRNDLSVFCRSLSECTAYIISSDTTGNGFPDRGTANTFDDAESAVQFSKEQTYMAVKAYAALTAAGTMLKSLEEYVMADKAEAQATLIADNLDKAAFLGDHYAVSIERSADGLVNVWTGEIMHGELDGWDAASPYISNGLLYLLVTSSQIALNRENLANDIRYVLARMGYFGSAHSTANPDGNFWISQNIWRDMIAAYLGILQRENVDRYAEFEQKMLCGDNGGGFIDSETAGGLFSYPRGIASIFLPYAVAGMAYDSDSRTLSFNPVMVPLSIPLPMFASWKDKKVPVISFSISGDKLKTEISNKSLLKDIAIYVSGKKEN